MRRRIFIGLVAIGLLLAGTGILVARERIARCGYVPLLAGDMLPDSDAALLEPNGPAGVLLPSGWRGRAAGVQVGDFTVTGRGRSFQLIGIANEVRTPGLPVVAGASYCIDAQAIADSRSATRLALEFHWYDEAGKLLATDRTTWQDVRRWEGQNDRGGWARIGGAYTAPAGALRLEVAFRPASDDRVYLDEIHLRQTLDRQRPIVVQPAPVTVAAWPEGRDAALSFSFDWETAMGGLIHSRSVDDPYGDDDPLVRAIRMREGVTTTLEIFRPYGIRATYYATGYNLLLGNPGRREFMGNPTFSWARREKPYSWSSDYWTRNPWFSSDPYGTFQSQPAWYFGDLIPLLIREDQDIQSHTFSHLYGGFASAEEWQADLETWRMVAAERGVAPARSLAFPWSGSGGMSFENWKMLEAAGITSVTRTSDQAQYRFVGLQDPYCRPVPGHEQILACPDFYLTTRSFPEALRLIDRTIAAGGMIDLWAHNEEVTSAEQIVVWREVVGYAAQQRDAGKLWIVPLAEIAEWQQALNHVQIVHDSGDSGQVIRVTNAGTLDLNDLALRIPEGVQQVIVDGQPVQVHVGLLVIDLRAGQTIVMTL